MNASLRACLVVLFMVGVASCTLNEMDGLWREETASLPPDDVADGEAGDAVQSTPIEMNIVQYGDEVAGSVWFFDQGVLSNYPDNPFGWPTFCRMLQRGRYSSGDRRLGLEYVDEAGVPTSLWLDYDGKSSLSGFLFSGEGEERRQRPISFSRMSTDPWERHKPGQCADMNSIYINGRVAEDHVAGAERPMVALMFMGLYLDHPFQFVMAVSPVSTDGRFSFNLSQKPPGRALAVDTSESSFGYGVFLLFDDLNDNGRWDYRPWKAEDPLRQGGGDEDHAGSGVVDEPMLGVAPEHALIWMVGRVGHHLPDIADLLGDVPQGYSLVKVESGERGVVRSLGVIPTVNSVVGADVVIAGATDGLPDLFGAMR